MRGLGFAALACLVSVLTSASAEAACVLGRFGELPVTMAGLSPTVPVRINGADVRMIADSGAFFSLLTPQAAKRLKLKVTGTPFGPAEIEGMGGREEAGVATATDLGLLGMTLHRADFLVAAPQLSREDVDGLLGNNILSYADVEFDLANGAIRLFKPTGCPPNVKLAYWATDGRFSDVEIPPARAPQFKIVVRVQVNGHDMHAILDSGAGYSYLTRTAARMAGVTTDASGVKEGGVNGGIGSRSFPTWIAPFQSFKIGDEEVKFTKLRIADASLPDADMLLGADFLLSHRVYVANSEHRLFFSYIGGPVFNLDREDGAAPPATQPSGGSPSDAAPTTAATAIPGAPVDQPTDADGFARRGAAFMARRDYAHAIEDYSRAIELEPAVAQHFYDRALARYASKQAAQANGDLDQVLKLRPDHVHALLIRAQLRIEAKNLIGARGDLEAATHADPDQRVTAAVLYLRADLFEPAIADLDGWLADHPKDSARGGVLNQRCWTRALWGRELERALDDCNAATKLLPGVAGALDSRGLVHLRLGQTDLALADYNAALKKDPKIGWSLYGRGLAEARLGQAKASQADLAAASAISPKLPEEAKRYGVTQ